MPEAMSNLKKLDYPLVLISQIQRSGGSMISQLFDGHPQVCAHPFEMHIGFPAKWDWRDFDLASSPREWFDQLFEKKVLQFIEEGYAKPGSNRFAAAERFAFDFSVERQKAIFLQCIAEIVDLTQRAIYDCYFAAFFNAWENWQPTGREKVITGFTPRVTMQELSIAKFFRDYPDGRLISCIRDPFSWYASASGHNPRYQDTNVALAEWMASVKAAVQLKRKHPHQVKLLQFSQLLTNPAEVMRNVAEFVGIEYCNLLTIPTYLGQPVRPNSSFNIEQYGINASMADRREHLSKDVERQIQNQADELYRDSLRLCG